MPARRHTPITLAAILKNQRMI